MEPAGLIEVHPQWLYGDSKARSACTQTIPASTVDAADHCQRGSEAGDIVSNGHRRLRGGPARAAEAD